MRVIRRLRNRSQAGLTLPELVTTVVIMGLVIAPLSMTLVQAITLVPDSSQRLTLSADNDILVSTLSDDVAQAAAIWHYGVNGTTGLFIANATAASPASWVFNDVPPSGSPYPSGITCTNTTDALGLPLLKVWHFDSSGPGAPIPQVIYYVAITGSGTYRKVVVTREYDNNLAAATPPPTTSVMLEGYCTSPTDAPALVGAKRPGNPAGSTNERVTLLFMLRDQDGTSRPPLSIETAIRRQG